jgi:hypothetical protein
MIQVMSSVNKAAKPESIQYIVLLLKKNGILKLLLKSDHAFTNRLSCI